MKKMSVFYITKHKKIKDIVKELETVKLEHERNNLKRILDERKKKIKQSFSIKKQIQQNPFKPLQRQYSEFSLVEPISKNQPFIPQKIKRSVDVPNRAYSSSPNMKVGEFLEMKENRSAKNEKQIQNRKFMQYDEIVDNQSGKVKKQRLQILKLQKKVSKLSKRSMKMKKTYFQRFLPDKFNFYDPSRESLNSSGHNHSSLKSSLMSGKQTDREMIRSRIQTLKTKKIYSTLDSSTSKQLQSSMLSCLDKSKFSKQKVQQFYAMKRIAQYREKMQSQIFPKLKDSAMKQSRQMKNLNSLDN